MKVTLITPHIGRKPSGKYVRTWQMEPLPIAVLAGMTPPDVQLEYFDERIEPVELDTPTDLVGISVETYTAKRAYEIAGHFRRRGVPVVLGGYHPTLVPEEARRFADSIVVGYAEGVWETVIRDAERKRLHPYYRRDRSRPFRFAMPRRDILAHRPYLKIACVEAGRGCPATCEFCSISSYTGARYVSRPVEEVVQDIRSLSTRTVFFVDDNVVGDLSAAKKLFRALVPLEIRWMSQGSLNMVRDPELVELMAASGCFGLLIGFESFRSDTLRLMNKGFNLPLAREYERSIRLLHRHGIAIYGAFVFGYDSEGRDDFAFTTREAIRLNLFLAAFNPLIPFPGTPLYERLREEKRLPREDWWLDPEFRFGDIPFTPKRLSAPALRRACIEARRRFFSLDSILQRAGNRRGNLTTLSKAAHYFYLNWKLRQEIDQKCGLPLGNEPVTPEVPSHVPLPLLTRRRIG